LNCSFLSVLEELLADLLNDVKNCLDLSVKNTDFPVEVSFESNFPNLSIGRFYYIFIINYILFAAVKSIIMFIICIKNIIH